MELVTDQHAKEKSEIYARHEEEEQQFDPWSDALKKKVNELWMFIQEDVPSVTVDSGISYTPTSLWLRFLGRPIRNASNYTHRKVHQSLTVSSRCSSSSLCRRWSPRAFKGVVGLYKSRGRFPIRRWE
jgi:hypothetical protein